LAGITGRTALGGRTRAEIAERLMHKQQQRAQRDQLVAACDLLETWGRIAAEPQSALAQMALHVQDDPAASALLETWRETLYLLDQSGVAMADITIQPDMARSWDYYTGLVFEVRTGADALLAGGGRYDELVQFLGGQHPVPAVGAAYYVDTVKQALRDRRTA
jgi:ATP phosphoribosyltransferase regulatory subunit